eukprot:COSAG02_NODE_3549_length_6580_cov_7.819883_2_plen_1698_part_00
MAARLLGVVVALLAVSDGRSQDGVGLRATSEPVNVAVKTRWDDTPMEAEAAEAVASLSGHDATQPYFWRFVRWSQGHPYAGERHSGITEENWYAAVMDGATQIFKYSQASSVAIGLLEVSLGNREFSPRVEMVRGVARDAWRATELGKEGAAMPCAWAVLGSGAAVRAGPSDNPAEHLEAALDAEPPEAGPAAFAARMAGEHIHPGSWAAVGKRSTVPTVILYGQLFTRELGLWLEELQTRCDAGQIALLLRLVDCGCTAATAAGRDTVTVLGYGVELAVKDSEYKAIDDQKRDAQPGSASEWAAKQRAAGKMPGSIDDDDDEDEEVEGFLFQRLIARNPKLEGGLRQLRTKLLSEALSDGGSGMALKVWEMEDLGIQAVKRVSTAPNPLAALRRISGDFPSLARPLSRLKLSPTFKQTVSARNAQLGGYPRNVLALNGQKVGSLGGRFASEGSDEYGKRATVAIHPFDAFELMGALREHAQRLDALAAIGVEPAIASSWLRPQLATREMGGGSGLVRYDSRFSDIVWMNDIETDDSKSNWPREVNNVLDYRRRNLWVRRNLFNSVAVVDPGTAEGLFTLAMMQGYISNGAPTRFGVVVVSGGFHGTRKFWDNWAAEAKEGGVEHACAASGRDNEAIGNVDVSLGKEEAQASAERRLKVAEDHGSELSYLMAKCFLFFVGNEHGGASAALRFANDVHAKCDYDRSRVRQEGDGFNNIDMRLPATKAIIRTVFLTSCDRLGISRGDNKWITIQSSGKYESQLNANEAFAQKLGVTETPTVFVNGVPWVGFKGEVIRQMSNAMIDQFGELQQAVQAGVVADDTASIHDALLQQSGTRTRMPPALGDPASSGLSPVWLPSLQKLNVRYLATVGTSSSIGDGGCIGFEQTGGCRFDGEREPAGDADCVHAIDSGRSGRCVCSDDRIVPFDCGHRASSCATACMRLQVSPISGWAFVDLTRISGRQLLAAVLRRHLQPPPQRQVMAQPRWAIIVQDDAVSSSFFAGAMRALLDCASVDSADSALAQQAVLLLAAALLREPEAELPSTVRDLVELLQPTGQGVSAVESCVLQSRSGSKSLDERLQEDRLLAAQAGIATDQSALLINGRWVALGAEPMLADDIIELEETARVKFADHALSSLEKHPDWRGWVLEDGSATVSDMVAIVSSLLPEPTTDTLQLPNRVDATVDIRPSTAHPLIEITVVTNPLSIEAHEAAVVAQTLLGSSLGHVLAVKVVLHPDTGIGRMSLDRYYRYILHSKPQFAEDGVRVTDIVSFKRLPDTLMLTLGLHSPAAWLVGLSESAHDFDNLVLKHAGNYRGSEPIKAVFTLDHLLCEGNAGYNSAGTQLYLGSEQDPRAQDTVVMQNHNYFQLKASPGVWWMHAGDSRKIMARNSGKESGLIKVTVDSWRGAHETIRVQQKAGDDGRSFLDSATESLQNAFFGSSNSGKGIDEETVHIFSLASGQLYERLLKVMVMGVRAHTAAPLKFWFLSNYASPHFKKFMPRMAVELGFEFEFVTYAWPHWLHRQTEKQRVMWAYKILFLDVLFPVAVKKVIFLDADLVLRADIKELYDLDLGGAPYGYTPFCQKNSREDTAGFRFWQQAWWQNHLSGRPYHISALYVVDLDVFRKLRAGDRLRSTYADMSQDENSLANLDQDLPNYAQHQIPIFSLPQVRMSFVYISRSVSLCTSLLSTLAMLRTCVLQCFL